MFARLMSRRGGARRAMNAKSDVSGLVPYAQRVAELSASGRVCAQTHHWCRRRCRINQEMPRSDPNPNTTPTQLAHQASRAIVRRALINQLGRWLVWTGFAALFLIAGSKLLSWEIGSEHWWVWLIAAGLLAVAMALVGALKSRLSEAQSAGVLDDRLGLQSQIRSAIEFDADRELAAESPGFVALAQSHAKSAASRVTIGDAIEPFELRDWQRAGVALVLAVVAGIWLPMRVVDNQETISVVPSHAIAKIDSVDELIADESALIPDSPAVEEAIAELESLKDELTQGVKDPDQANARTAAKLEELADAIDDQAQGEQSQADELSDRIAQAQNQSQANEDHGWDEQLNEFADAIKEQDYQQAQDELEQIREQLDQMSPEDREAFADQLEQLADAVEPDSNFEDPGLDESDQTDDPMQDLADSIRDEADQAREQAPREQQQQQESESESESESQSSSPEQEAQDGQKQSTQSEQQSREGDNGDGEQTSQEVEDPEGAESGQQSSEQQQSQKEQAEQSEQDQVEQEQSEQEQSEQEQGAEQGQSRDQQDQPGEGQGESEQSQRQAAQTHDDSKDGAGDESGKQPEDELKGQDAGEKESEQEPTRQGRRSLDEALEDMENRKEQSQKNEERADNIRDDARELIQEDQDQDPREGESSGRQASSDQQPAGRGAGDQPRSAQEDSPIGDEPRDHDFVPVDGADKENTQAGEPVGKWYAPEGEASEPANTKQTAGRLRQASEKAQRAIEDQQVPRKYQRVVREAFKRIKDRANALDSGGSVAPQGKDADAKPSKESSENKE